MPVSCYVALPFVRNEEGKLVPGEAQDRRALRQPRARRMRRMWLVRWHSRLRRRPATAGRPTPRLPGYVARPQRFRKMPIIRHDDGTARISRLRL